MTWRSHHQTSTLWAYLTNFTGNTSSFLPSEISLLWRVSTSIIPDPKLIVFLRQGTLGSMKVMLGLVQPHPSVFKHRFLSTPHDTNCAESCKEIKPISPEYSSEGVMLKLSRNTLATWPKELTHWKTPWCWERLKARREGADRGWDGWMASRTQWTWVWASSGRWWRTRKPGVLQSMGSQGVGHDWVPEQQWQPWANLLTSQTLYFLNQKRR